MAWPFSTLVALAYALEAAPAVAKPHKAFKKPLGSRHGARRQVSDGLLHELLRL